MAVEDASGNLQGAMASGSDFHNDGSTYGCWRWWGSIHMPRHEWSVSAA